MPVFYWQSINFNEKFLKYFITYEFMKKICFKNIKSLSFRDSNCYNSYVSSTISLFLNLQTQTTFNWDRMLRFITWRWMVIKFNHNSFSVTDVRKPILNSPYCPVLWMHFNWFNVYYAIYFFPPEVFVYTWYILHVCLYILMK